MTAPNPKQQWDQAAEVVLSVAAAWLAFRGQQPGDVAARTMRVAGGVCRALERMDDLGKDVIRRAVGCVAPAHCQCLWCASGEDEGKKGSQ